MHFVVVEMNIPTAWCNQVSRSTGMPPDDVKNNVIKWYNNGRSFDYIKNILIIRAKLNGRKLMFVSRHGKN